MVLPLYLAVTSAEISSVSKQSEPMAYMACQFSPYTQGLTNIPDSLPNGSMLILTDRMSCQGHSANLVANQLSDAAERLCCDSLLLDFQRPPDAESESMVKTIVETLSCPVAVTESFAEKLSCPVFLSPSPLHIPLSEYLTSWENREIWLEAALDEEIIAVKKTGTEFIQQFPPDRLEGGFFDEELCCHYRTVIADNQITFQLFDTHQSLKMKLDLAQSLGVTRAVGLWQELRAL